MPTRRRRRRPRTSTGAKCACSSTAGRSSSKGRDRKSTRLNSSHRCISYAVFCLKNKIQDRKVHLLKVKVVVPSFLKRHIEYPFHYHIRNGNLKSHLRYHFYSYAFFNKLYTLPIV